MGLLSILIGIFIAYGSVFFLKREIHNGLSVMKKQYPGINDDNTSIILSQFDKMESLVNELNESYYEITSDLEGKYSVHEKEISIIEGRLSVAEKEIRQLKTKQVRNREVENKVSNNQPNVEENASQKNLDPNKMVEITETGVSNTHELLNLSEREKVAYRRRVIELRQKGLNLSQIARELGVGVGELQLFLNLNKSK